MKCLDFQIFYRKKLTVQRFLKLKRWLLKDLIWMVQEEYLAHGTGFQQIKAFNLLISYILSHSARIQMLQHQRGPCRLQSRFSTTDHREHHFREESLEKVIILTSKRRVTCVKRLVEISKSCSTRILGVGAAARRAAAKHAFRNWIGKFWKCCEWQIAANLNRSFYWF